MRWGKSLVLLCLLGMFLVVGACTGSQAPTDSPSIAGMPVPEPPRDSVKTVRLGISRWAGTEVIQATEQELNRILEESAASVRVEFVPFEDNVFFTDEEMMEDHIGDFDILPGVPLETDFEAFAKTGYAMDIADLLVRDPNLLTLADEAAWRESTLDGRNYWFPLMAFSDGLPAEGTLSVDQAVLDVLDEEYPRTLEEMLAILREAKANGLPYKLLSMGSNPPYILHRTYDEWPFYVDYRSFFIYYADGGMEPYVDSDVFQKDIALLRELDAEELLYVYSEESEVDLSDLEALEIAMCDVSQAPWEGTRVYTSGVLEPDRPIPRIDSAVYNALFISRDCADPEAALELIRAIYTNSKAAMTLAFGVEGTDWALNDDGFLEGTPTLVGGRHAFYLYTTHMPFLGEEEIGEWGEISAWGESVAEDYPYSGFSFLAFPPLSDAMRFAQQHMYDLRQGILPATEWEAVRQEMYDEGLQALFDAYKVRYEEFLAR